MDMSGIRIKEEYEEHDYINSTVILPETNIKMNDPELNSTSWYDTGIADNIKTEFFFPEVPNSAVHENHHIKDEACAGDDFKIVLKNERLFCNNCCEEYEDYCTKCGMLERILNGNMLVGARDEVPKNILEIRDSSGVYALKVIPECVIFGPFTGLSATEYTSRLKNGKLIIDDDEHRFSNWMKHVNSTENPTEQNLLVYQYEGNLYYRSSREIQKGEQLLVHFADKQYKVDSKEDVKMEFSPLKDWELKNVFACTFCCLGFSSKPYLLHHKSICPYNSHEAIIIEELTECISCKIFLEQKEYLEHHVTYCDGNTVKRTVTSSPDLRLANVEPHSSTSAGYKRRRKPRKSDLEARVIGNEYKCAECDYETGYRGNLKAHVTVKHLNQKKYKCTECEYETGYRTHVERHMTAKHLNEKNYHCADCSYKTCDKRNLDIHVKIIHLNEKNYKCSQCDYRSGYKSHLETHVKTKHLNEKNYACADCDYKTSYKRNLAGHRKVKHLNEKRFKCPQCDHRTSYKLHLDGHIRAKHLNEKNYKCTECDFKSSYKGKLTEHVKVKHRNEKNYGCTECEYKSAYKRKLEEHVKAKHRKEWNYACSECGFRTKCMSYLRKHIRLKHVSKKDAIMPHVNPKLVVNHT